MKTEPITVYEQCPQDAKIEVDGNMQESLRTSSDFNTLFHTLPVDSPPHHERNSPPTEHCGDLSQLARHLEHPSPNSSPDEKGKKTRSPQKTKPAKIETMQAYHARAVQQLEKEREEKAASKATSQRRLQARELAARRELEQVRRKREAAKKKLEAQLLEAGEERSAPGAGVSMVEKDVVSRTATQQSSSSYASSARSRSSQASKLLIAARQLQGQRMKTPRDHAIGVEDQPMRKPPIIPTLRLTCLAADTPELQTSRSLTASPSTRASVTRSTPSLTNNITPSAIGSSPAVSLPQATCSAVGSSDLVVLPVNASQTSQNPSQDDVEPSATSLQKEEATQKEQEHEHNMQRMLTQVTSLQQRLAALAQPEAAAESLGRVEISAAQPSMPEAMSHDVSALLEEGEEVVLTSRQFPMSHPLMTARSFVDTPRVDNEFSPERQAVVGATSGQSRREDEASTSQKQQTEEAWLLHQDADSILASQPRDRQHLPYYWEDSVVTGRSLPEEFFQPSGSPPKGPKAEEEQHNQAQEKIDQREQRSMPRNVGPSDCLPAQFEEDYTEDLKGFAPRSAANASLALLETDKKSLHSSLREGIVSLGSHQGAETAADLTRKEGQVQESSAMLPSGSLSRKHADQPSGAATKPAHHQLLPIKLQGPESGPQTTAIAMLSITGTAKSAAEQASPQAMQPHLPSLAVDVTASNDNVGQGNCHQEANADSRLAQQEHSDGLQTEETVLSHQDDSENGLDYQIESSQTSFLTVTQLEHTKSGESKLLDGHEPDSGDLASDEVNLKTELLMIKAIESDQLPDSAPPDLTMATPQYRVHESGRLHQAEGNESSALQPQGHVLLTIAQNDGDRGSSSESDLCASSGAARPSDGESKQSEMNDLHHKHTGAALQSFAEVSEEDAVSIGDDAASGHSKLGEMHSSEGGNCNKQNSESQDQLSDPAMDEFQEVTLVPRASQESLRSSELCDCDDSSRLHHPEQFTIHYNVLASEGGVRYRDATETALNLIQEQAQTFSISPPESSKSDLEDSSDIEVDQSQGNICIQQALGSPLKQLRLEHEQNALVKSASPVSCPQSTAEEASAVVHRMMFEILQKVNAAVGQVVEDQGLLQEPASSQKMEGGTIGLSEGNSQKQKEFVHRADADLLESTEGVEQPERATTALQPMKSTNTHGQDIGPLTNDSHPVAASAAQQSTLSDDDQEVPASKDSAGTVESSSSCRLSPSQQSRSGPRLAEALPSAAQIDHAAPLTDVLMPLSSKEPDTILQAGKKATEVGSAADGIALPEKHLPAEVDAENDPDSRGDVAPVDHPRETDESARLSTQPMLAEPYFDKTAHENETQAAKAILEQTSPALENKQAAGQTASSTAEMPSAAISPVTLSAVTDIRAEPIPGRHYSSVTDAPRASLHALTQIESESSPSPPGLYDRHGHKSDVCQRGTKLHECPSPEDIPLKKEDAQNSPCPDTANSSQSQEATLDDGCHTPAMLHGLKQEHAFLTYVPDEGKVLDLLPHSAEPKQPAELATDTGSTTLASKDCIFEDSWSIQDQGLQEPEKASAEAGTQSRRGKEAAPLPNLCREEPRLDLGDAQHIWSESKTPDPITGSSDNEMVLRQLQATESATYFDIEEGDCSAARSLRQTISAAYYDCEEPPSETETTLPQSCKSIEQHKEEQSNSCAITATNSGPSSQPSDDETFSGPHQPNAEMDAVSQAEEEKETEESSSAEIGMSQWCPQSSLCDPGCQLWNARESSGGTLITCQDESIASLQLDGQEPCEKDLAQNEPARDNSNTGNMAIELRLKSDSLGSTQHNPREESEYPADVQPEGLQPEASAVHIEGQVVSGAAADTEASSCSDPILESGKVVKDEEGDVSALVPDSTVTSPSEYEADTAKSHLAAEMEDESQPIAKQDQILPGKGTVSCLHDEETAGKLSAYWPACEPHPSESNREEEGVDEAEQASSNELEALADSLASSTLRDEMESILDHMNDDPGHTSRQSSDQALYEDQGTGFAVPVSAVQQSTEYIQAYVSKVIGCFLESYSLDSQAERSSAVGLKRFLDIERGFEGVSDDQHIFNKALFDASNQAIQQLIPPYRSRLTVAQANVKREDIQSQAWESALHKEVELQVMKWCHPNNPGLDEDTAMRELLIRDVHQDDFAEMCSRTRLI